MNSLIGKIDRSYTLLTSMDVFRVYDTNMDRIRLGEMGGELAKERCGDGGYVLFDGLEYDYLISGGVDDTIKFEKEFMNKYDVAVCDLFDNSIDELPEANSEITFYKKSISNENSESSTNLKSFIRKHKNVFVKMDIEGHEWKWLNSLEEDDFNNIKQMAIELHLFFEMSNGTNIEELFIKRLMTVYNLNKYFYLMHVHANNCAPSFKYNNVEYPHVIECTYINKNVFKDNSKLFVTKNVRSFPLDIDRVNCPNMKDINHLLNKEPFKTNTLELIKP